jgi:dTDP-4-dehydrorhamnose reductase
LIAGILRRSHRVPFGTYNAVGGSVASWHEFAEIIVAQAYERGVIGKCVPVRAITTAAYPTPARRPANSVLQNAELLRALGIAMDWRNGLTAALTTVRA